MAMYCLVLTLAFGGDLPTLEADIKAAIAGQTAVYGIAFRDLASGETLTINGDDRMHAASTMKTPVMMRLFEMIDRGELRLDQPIEVRNQFHSIVDGSPFQIQVDSDESLYAHLGKTLPLVALIEAMIARSSNLATNILIEMAGAERTTALMHELGAADILVRRGVEDLKAFDRDLNNESSAAAMRAVMAACAQSDHFSPESRRQMWDILLLQAYNDMIPAGLPADSGAVVAHKTGSISRVQHDAAIVQLTDGHRYVLVVFARDFGDEAGRAQVKTTATQISRLVYTHVTTPSP